MVDFKTLEAFVRVAQLGSFRAAAERLGTTQPAISQRLALLEQELGFDVLARGPRGTVLTARGRTALGYAERLIALRSEMLTSVMEPDAMSGVVRLGVAETIVHTWLGRFVERVTTTFPGITLDIEVDITYNLREALETNRLDLAFLLGPVSGSNIANAPLSRYPLAYVARPDLPLPDGPVPLSAIAHYPIITYQKQTIPYSIVQDSCARAGIAGVRIFATSSLSTIARMTLDGIGISLIPPAVIQRELSNGELRIIETEDSIPVLDFTVTWAINSGSHLAEALARLAQKVAAEE